MKRIFALLLAAMLLLSLAACDMDFDYQGKIVGTWIIREEDSDENRDYIFQFLELYDDEIAQVDATLYTAKALTFNEDGTYSMIEDVDTLKVYVREFLDELFADLYAGRAQLAGTYAAEGVDLSQLTEEEFYLFYTALYSYDSYDQLLDDLTEAIYDYDTIQPYETGTYTVGSKKIDFDADEDEYDGFAEYSVSGNKLTVKFENGTEVYTRK